MTRDEWIEQGFAALRDNGPGALALNPHWRPQATRLRRAAPLRLRRFPVELAERLIA